MHKTRSQHVFGFTIVELLVVIVVIGVLAAISLVSYTSISSKAVVASLQSDLSISAKSLKMYYIDHGTYPQSLDLNNCPVSPAPDSKYCLKSSLGNTIAYCPSTPYSTFTIKNTSAQGVTYAITNNTAPVLADSLPAVFSSGGAITTNSCNRTHTFGPGTYNLTAALSGTLIISLSGAGAGGGGGADCNDGGGGYPGAYSSLTIGSGTWRVNGGNAGGGGTTDCYTWALQGSPGSGGTTQVSGTATMTGWSATTGGGSQGGAGGSGNVGGGAGGSGGKLVGNITVNSGQSVTVISGAGGSGGSAGGAQASSGGNGASGVVTVSYPY